MSGRPVIRSRYRAQVLRGSPVMALYLVLPFALGAFLMLGFPASLAHDATVPARPQRPVAAYVRLSSAAYGAARARVRTAWQADGVRTETFEIERGDFAFSRAERLRPPVSLERPPLAPLKLEMQRVDSSAVPSLAPPTMAAPPAAELPADSDETPEAELFTRGQLLEFDFKILMKGNDR